MNSPAVTQPLTPTTKLCHLIKRPDFEGYGFNLHSEKAKPGQFIGKVDSNSPAEAAGLKKGDRIIEVNGSPIGNETHKQVVQLIKAVENEVRLLLIDVDGPNNDLPQKIESSPTETSRNSMKDFVDSNKMNNNNNNNNNKNNTTDETEEQYKNRLQLPLTAAEMRAQLLSKKKYDPKSESVDIKKKFQIIQTL